MFEPASINALIGNIVAVILAFWMRLSIETYPGIRRSSVILPSALTGHGVVVVWFVLTRFPYDRLGLAAGFLLHVAWLYLLYIHAERKVRRRIAVVPFGATDRLDQIEGVDWHMLKRPAAPRRARLQRHRRRLQRRPARRVGGVPRRRGACRAHRLSGQAAVGIADRPGRARAFVGEQLRLAGAARSAISTSRAWSTSSFALLLLPLRAAGHGRGRDRHSPRQPGIRRCSARSGSATPAGRSPSTSSGRCDWSRSRTSDARR